MNWYCNTAPKCEPHKCSDELLVSVKTMWGNRVLKAVYIADHNCTVEDMGWNMWDGVPDNWEYDEDLDDWWIAEGWYETADNFEEYEYAGIEGDVYAWAKLPKAYEPRVKEIGGNNNG